MSIQIDLSSTATLAKTIPPKKEAKMNRTSELMMPSPYPPAGDPHIRSWAEHFSEGRMIVGTGVDGAPIIWDLKSDPHALVAGRSGSGRSGLIIQLLFQAATSPTGSTAVVVGAADEFGWAAHTPGVTVATSSSDVAASFAAAAAECKQRHHHSTDRTRLFVLCDDFDTVRRSLPNQAMHDLLFVARTGGPVGVHLLLSGQRPTSDAVPPSLRECLTFRAVTGIADHYTSALMFSVDPDPALWVPQRGWTVTQSARGVEAGQIPWLPVTTSAAPWEPALNVEGATERLRQHAANGSNSSEGNPKT